MKLDKRCQARASFFKFLAGFLCPLCRVSARLSSSRRLCTARLAFRSSLFLYSPSPLLFSFLFAFFSRCSRDNAGSARADLPFVCNFSLATARFPFRFATAARGTSRRRRILFYVGEARNGNMRANSSRGIRRVDVRIDRRPFFRDLPNVRFPSRIRCVHSNNYGPRRFYFVGDFNSFREFEILIVSRCFRFAAKKG